jgi:hypothetical protein
MAQALLLVIRDEDAEASDATPTDVVGPQVSGAMSQGRGRGEPPYSTPLRMRTNGPSSGSSTQGRRSESTKGAWKGWPQN